MKLLLTRAALTTVEGRLPSDVEPEVLEQLEGRTPTAEAAWFSFDMFADREGAKALFEAMLGAPDLQWLQSASAGLDAPPFRRVMQKGVRITKSDAQAPSIAEYVMAHALSLLHPIEPHLAHQRARRWERIPYREIADTAWLIVGYGKIGQEVARRLKPFGARITAVRRQAGEDPFADRVVGRDQLLSVLPEADVVVLCSALNDETRDMADAEFFDAVKPGAILINVGRGELVVEEALREALNSDRLGSAVLDVFRQEPLPSDAWFWDHPKVRVTPHDSPVGSGLRARIEAIFLENLRRYLAGEPLLNEAQPRELGL